LDAVVAAGVTYLDTAPWYGAGLSETRLGEYTKAKSVAVTISTKCGRIVKPRANVNTSNETIEEQTDGFKTDAYHSDVCLYDATAGGIRESFRQSCARLQVDTIHCLRLHDAETPERWEQAVNQGGVDAMVQLRKEGKIKEVSMGFNKSDYLLKFLQHFPAGTFDSIMMAGAFNLIDQDGVELLRECQKRNVKVTNVGIFASGVLWGSTHYKYSGIPAEVVAKVDKWKALAEKYGLPLPQLALNFALLPTAVENVAFGCKTAEKVKTNLDLCGKAVPPELWAEAKATNLIAEGVPLPA